MIEHRADVQRVVLADGSGAVLGTAGARLLARLVDFLVVGIPFLVVLLVGFGFPHGLLGLGAAGLGFVVLLLGYEVALTSLRGGTVGKRLAGVVVTGTDGTPPRTRQVVIRSLVLLGPVFLPAAGQLYLLACVVSAVRDERARRGWPDRAAGTVVLAQP